MNQQQHQHTWITRATDRRICAVKQCFLMQRLVNGVWVDVRPPNPPNLPERKNT